jgi:hypothetical protein
MSTLIDKMLIEEDSQLTPQLKRMKLNSKSDSLTTELSRSNFIQSDPKEHLKTNFPYFSEEVNINSFNLYSEITRNS